MRPDRNSVTKHFGVSSKIRSSTLIPKQTTVHSVSYADPLTGLHGEPYTYTYGFVIKTPKGTLMNNKHVVEIIDRLNESWEEKYLCTLQPITEGGIYFRDLRSSRIAKEYKCLRFNFRG